MKCKLDGKWYDICVNDVEGLCITPGIDMPTIWIGKPLETRRGMEIAIHEALHALNESLSEGEVSRLGAELSRFLWKLGYRHGSKKPI